MTDREKVIKGLECCTFILGKRKCNECPYQSDNGCYQLQDDFHAMLKEQEAVVRCKDCKHSEEWYGDKRRCFLWHESGIDVFEDGFCNYGKRK